MRLCFAPLLILSSFGQTPPAALPKAVSPSPVSTVPQWRVKFFHDQNDSSIDFREVVTPAPGYASAFGILAEDGRRPRGVLVQTRDAGKSWQTIKLPDLPLSADFLDAQTGWLVFTDAVHGTTDGGLTWKRLAKLKGVLRVKFVTPQRGFAVGFPKAVWSTSDGGTTWAKVPEAALPSTKAENSVYNTIAFRDPQNGLITGFSRPPRRDESRAPAWMDPEAQKRQVPNLLIALATSDGGKTWTQQTGSAFGQVVKSVFGRVGLGLIDYANGTFEYPNEVINLANSKTAFADKEKSIRDVVLDADGRAWLAGVEVPGKLNQLPIPSKVLVLQSIDYEHWYPTPVSYRATATRVKISFGAGKGWLATDTGMILAFE